MRISTIRYAGILLAVLMVFSAGQAYAQRNVTLRLNTATAPDTLRTTDEIQVRGCLEGCEGDQSALPGDGVIAWNDNTTLKPMNIGGDYWETTFQVQDDTTMFFKFYSQLLEDDGVGGWEDGDNHQLESGTGDTTFTLHYYRKGSGAAYDWRPFESKEDTIAVWFRVYMATPNGDVQGYDPDANAPDQTVGIRGDSLDSGTAFVPPFSWGSTNATLERESTTSGQPGYDLYSGVVYYPSAFAGMEQAFKFVVENGGNVGWEDRTGGDRRFTVPDSDSTLQWVYFGDEAPSQEEPVMSEVIFTVDLEAFEEIGIFRKSRGDTIEVRGDFNGWDCPAPGDDCLLQEVFGVNQFERAITISRVPNRSFFYKYYLNFDNDAFMTEFGVEPPNGWEEGFQTGINRERIFTGEAVQDLGVTRFNEVRSENVIPDGTSIDLNFTVDMSSTSTVQPFNPAGGDSVFITVEDPIFAFTQGYTDFISAPDFPDVIGVLTDDDTDGVYTGTLTINGPTYGVLTWRYTYGQRVAGVYTGFTEPGNGNGPVPGRRRAFWMMPNPDGSWPASYDLTDAFQPEEETALPFNTNTVAVEQIGSDLPETVTLMSNYPNPFSESTSFEYTVTEKTDVKISVYNVIGQHVATVVDAVQPAGTYRANFEAKDLASGTYFYRLETNGRVMSRPMILVR